MSDILHLLFCAAPSVFLLIGVCALVKIHVGNEYTNKLLESNLNPMVVEIIRLTETDPDGWLYKHKEMRDGKEYMSHHVNSEHNILVSTTNSHPQSIYRPVEINLSSTEAEALKIAFDIMWAEKISQRSLQKLLTA